MKTPPPRNYRVPRPLACIICRAACVGQQRDPKGRPAHFSCQQTTAGTVPAEEERDHR